MKLTLTSCSNIFSFSLLYVKLVSPGSHRWASCVVLQKRFEGPYLSSSSAAKLLSGRKNALDLDIPEYSGYGSEFAVDYMEARDQPFRSGSSANLGEAFIESTSRSVEDSVPLSSRRVTSVFSDKARRNGQNGPLESLLPDSVENQSRENSQPAPRETLNLASPSDPILSYFQYLRSQHIPSADPSNTRFFTLLPHPANGVTDGQKFYPLLGESPASTRMRSLRNFFNRKRKRESEPRHLDVFAEASPVLSVDTELLGKSPSPHFQPLGEDYISPFQFSGYSKKIETAPAFHPSAGWSNSHATFNYHQAGGQNALFRYEPVLQTPSDDPFRTPVNEAGPLNTPPRISMRVSPNARIPPSVGDPASTSPRFIGSSPINIPSSSTKSSDQSERSFERTKGNHFSGYESVGSPTSQLASPGERSSILSPFITPASSTHVLGASAESSHDSKMSLESIENFLFSDIDPLDSFTSSPASAPRGPHQSNIMHDSEKLQPSPLLGDTSGWLKEAFKNHETYPIALPSSPLSAIPFADVSKSSPLLNAANNKIKGPLPHLATPLKSTGENTMSSRWEWTVSPGLGAPATSKASSRHTQFTGHRNSGFTHSNTPASTPTDFLDTSVPSFHDSKKPRQNTGNIVSPEKKESPEINPYFRLPMHRP